MSKTLRLLLLEDSPEDAELAVATLENAGYSCEWDRVETRKDFLRQLEDSEYDIVLTDYSMPMFDGLSAVKVFLDLGLDIPIIHVSGTIGEEIATESIKAGATDFVLKDKMFRLPHVVDRALRESAQIRQNRQVELERRTIFEIIQASVTSLNLEEFLPLAHRALSKVLYAENCYVMLYEQATDTIHFEFWVDKQDPQPQPKKLGTGFASYVLRTGLPLRLTDKVKKQLKESGEADQIGTASAAWIGVPLRTASNTIGVLVLQHYKDKSAYSDRDLELLTSVGDQIAFAIQRKRAEEALLESNRKFNELANNINDVFWIRSADLREVLYISPAFERIWGRPLESMYANPQLWADLILPEDRERVERAFTSLLGGAGLDIEYRIVLPDGETRWVRVRGFPVRDDTEKVVRNVGIVTDVTERKKADQKFKELLESAPDAMILVNGEGEIALINAQTEKLFGWRRDELRRRSIESIIPERFRVNHHRFRKDFFGAPKARAMGSGNDLYGLRKDGTEFPTEISLSPIETEKGTMVMAAIRDITQRKRIESERGTIYEVIRAAAETTHLDDFFKLVHNSIKKVMYAENCFVMLREKSTERVFFEYWVGEYEPPAESAEIGNGFASYVLRTGMPLRLTKEAQRELKRAGKAMAIGTPSASWIGVPLRTSLQTIGVLVLQHYEMENVYSDRDLEFLNSVGHQIGIAIERKWAQEALARSEEQYRDLVENAQDIIYTHDVSGNYLSINKAVEAMLGYTVAEVLAMNIMQLVAPEHREIAIDMVHAKVRDSDLAKHELDVVARDGSHVALEVSTRLIYEAGEPVAVQGIARDVTARRIAAKAVEDANMRALAEYEILVARLSSFAFELGNAHDMTAVFRALREFAGTSAPTDGLFVSLYDSEKDERTAAYAWIGGDEMDVADLPPMPMSGSPQSTAVATGQTIITNDFQTAMEGLPIMHLGLDKDPLLPQSSLAAPMILKGRVVGAVEVQSTKAGAFTNEHATAIQMGANLTATAIENVRLFESEAEKANQLRHSQKLESVGMLAGGIAHDFNNMLTAINGYSDLALRKLTEDDPLRRSIVEIKKAGERSAELTHQLLAFSRKQVLQPVVLDLNEVVTETSRMLVRVIGEDVELITSLNSQAARVHADPGQLSQIMMNLAVNARDAMPKGGRLTIETADVFLSADRNRGQSDLLPGAYVMLTVSDTGSGMKAEVKERIFEPFFTTKETGKGTGLGLATVYGIVKQSGGNIEVYSEESVGTTFEIYLPSVAEQAEKLEVKVASSELPKGTETVLLVEDEEMVRQLAKQVLEECGYTVVEACNGLEALEIYEKGDHRFDLLMTDLVMPEMGGSELFEILMNKAPDLQILFTSGYTDSAVVRSDLIGAGVNFIQKPFSPEMLATKVRKICDDSRNTNPD